MKQLDLHGVRHAEAPGAICRFINDNWEEGKDVLIITGHSPEMKQIVIDQCVDYKVRYYCSVHEPMVKVYLSEVI